MKAINWYLYRVCCCKTNCKNFKDTKNKLLNIFDFCFLLTYLIISVYNVFGGNVSKLLFMTTLVMNSRVVIGLIREQNTYKNRLKKQEFLKFNQYLTTTYSGLLILYVVLLLVYKGSIDTKLIQVMAFFSYILYFYCDVNKIIKNLFNAQQLKITGIEEII